MLFVTIKSKPHNVNGENCFALWVIVSEIFAFKESVDKMLLFSIENVKIKISSNKMLPPLSIEPRPLINYQHSPFWANWAFACKTETLDSLCSHALLIPTKSFKFKNQVVHKQKFKDPLSSTCQISSERRVLDLDSEAQGFSLSLKERQNNVND